MTDGWIDKGTDDVYVTMTGTIMVLQQLTISNSYPNPHWKWLYLVLGWFGEDLLPITLLITIDMHTLTHLDLTVCLILYHVLYLGMHLKYLDESSNNPNWP